MLIHTWIVRSNEFDLKKWYLRKMVNFRNARTDCKIEYILITSEVLSHYERTDRIEKIGRSFMRDFCCYNALRN